MVTIRHAAIDVPTSSPFSQSHIHSLFVFFVQNRFDALWRKYITYSGGEELFGLAVTEYPDLMQIRRELNLLQKLYGLYNDVIDTVNGYYDILWVDVNIEKINIELQDFQTRWDYSGLRMLD